MVNCVESRQVSSFCSPLPLSKWSFAKHEKFHVTEMLASNIDAQLLPKSPKMSHTPKTLQTPKMKAKSPQFADKHSNAAKKEKRGNNFLLKCLNSSKFAGDLEAPELLMYEFQATFSRVDLWVASTMAMYKATPSERESSRRLQKASLVWRYMKEDAINLLETPVIHDETFDDGGIEHFSVEEVSASIYEIPNESCVEQSCFYLNPLKVECQKQPELNSSGLFTRRMSKIGRSPSLKVMDSPPVLMKHRREILAQSSMHSFEKLHPMLKPSRELSYGFTERSSLGTSRESYNSDFMGKGVMAKDRTAKPQFPVQLKAKSDSISLPGDSFQDSSFFFEVEEDDSFDDGVSTMMRPSDSVLLEEHLLVERQAKLISDVYRQVTFGLPPRAPGRSQKASLPSSPFCQSTEVTPGSTIAQIEVMDPSKRTKSM